MTHVGAFGAQLTYLDCWIRWQPARKSSLPNIANPSSSAEPFLPIQPCAHHARLCVERWHVCLCCANRRGQDLSGICQQANPRGRFQRTLRRLICRNSETTDKPEERKPSGFLLFGSTTALTSRTARKSLGKGPSNEQGKCRSASFEASNSTALIAGLLDWVFAEFGLWITVFFRHDDFDPLPDVDAAPGLRNQRSICPRFAFITDPLITGVCAAKSRVRAISEGSIKRP